MVLHVLSIDMCNRNTDALVHFFQERADEVFRNRIVETACVSLMSFLLAFHAVLNL